MLRNYHFSVNQELLQKLVLQKAWPEVLDVLAAPMHEWLYEEQDFEALQSRTPAEQLILSIDYVGQQVLQGGFIQLVQNGYTPLLVTVIESLQALELAPEMIAVLDDALKVIVLNKDVLGKETSVEEFGKLYQEFGEFEPLETRFNELLPATVEALVTYLRA